MVATQLIALVAQWLLVAIGLTAIVILGAVKMAPKLPYSFQKRIADNLISRGIGALGGQVVIVQEDDGIVDIDPAVHDPDNNGYWRKSSEGLKDFFSAEGGQASYFFGGTAVLAYDGLASIQDAISGEIARQKKIKNPNTNPAPDFQSRTRKILPFVGPKDGSDGEAVADGGVTELDEYDLALPKRKIVDLRDTVDAVPFNIEPSMMHRVERNMEVAKMGFMKNPLVFGTLIIGSFVMGMIMTWFIMNNAGGAGGGGGISLPFMIAPW